VQPCSRAAPVSECERPAIMATLVCPSPSRSCTASLAPLHCVTPMLGMS
jgi:hypothetical protein